MSQRQRCGQHSSVLHSSTNRLFLYATPHDPLDRRRVCASRSDDPLRVCTSYRVEYMEESLRQTTQAELVYKFGYPQQHGL